MHNQPPPLSRGVGMRVFFVSGTVKMNSRQGEEDKELTLCGFAVTNNESSRCIAIQKEETLGVFAGDPRNVPPVEEEKNCLMLFEKHVLLAIGLLSIDLFSCYPETH